MVDIKELAERSGLKMLLEVGGMDKCLEHFANLAAEQERAAIMKSIEELRPVENIPLLQTKPAAFWIENFRQIVYARSNT